MRRFSICFLLGVLLLLEGCSSAVSNIGTVEKIIPVPNETKNELYVKANNWMVDTFTNAKSVVQFTDKESGTISGRYFLGNVVPESQYGAAINVFATIKIRVKDKACRIQITPDQFSYVSGMSYYTEDMARKDINSLIGSFESSMSKNEDEKW